MPGEIVHVKLGRCWYTVIRWAADDYEAEILGQVAHGPTPEDAIRNAARKHTLYGASRDAPYTTSEE